MDKQNLRKILFYFILLISGYSMGKAVSQKKLTSMNHWDPFAHAHWKAKCSLDSETVEFRFDSTSGHVAEDDMEVLIKVNKKVIPANLKKDLYQALPMPTGFNSLCDLIPGISPAKDQLLVIIGRNGRPSFDHIVGFLIDLKKGNVLQINDDLGAFTMVDNTGKDFSSLQIENVKNGFRVLSVHGNRPEIHNSDGPDAFIFGWQQILAQGGKIASHWENQDLVKPLIKKSTTKDLSRCRKECEKMRKENQLKSGTSLNACTKSVCSKDN